MTGETKPWRVYHYYPDEQGYVGGDYLLHSSHDTREDADRVAAHLEDQGYGTDVYGPDGQRGGWIGRLADVLASQGKRKKKS